MKLDLRGGGGDSYTGIIKAFYLVIYANRENLRY